jgi:hypothetical protein
VILVFAFGLALTMTSLAAWMGWGRRWTPPPTNLVSLSTMAALPIGVGTLIAGVAIMLPTEGTAYVASGVLAIVGVIFMILGGVAGFTISTWARSSWFRKWIASRYPGRNEPTG